MKPRPFFEQGLHDALPAIEKLMEVAGGQTALGIQVGTSGQTIANVREARRVSNSVLAHRMGDLAAELGWPAITSRVLSGMVEWNGEQFPDPQEKHKGPNGSGPSLPPPSARPGAGGTDTGREARAQARGAKLRKTARAVKDRLSRFARVPSPVEAMRYVGPLLAESAPSNQGLSFKRTGTEG